mmetsp:Transcript_29581/g.65161  ORF Transcript_29581/g.65161 Transcript_29581/m.65161 type:complete len:213 (-) Transcript_29581:75-713(-)|eukprot:CAMPEP_0178496380 /NCGR_PEP_ID=MMETSP0696-20121128/14086_1 /TAXON_ID=265572 /ORGANISM="Extubocellulus spinifer, Strain CCMP396" /LENGTH=212 /DNA_ID=CAMNT_0020124659 /DNA_START=230 /DNA_END=868 /DNA_ORIENTATION=+
MEHDSKQPNRRSGAVHPSPTSVDDALAQATSKSLTMGPSTVDRPWYAFALPKKLHPGLYTSTLGDAPMTTTGSSSAENRKKYGNGDKSTGGVPGFPEFPDFWQGESSAERKNNKGRQDSDASLSTAERRGTAKTTARIRRRQKRMVRKAVNPTHGSATRTPGGMGAGRELKRRLRDQRRLRRIEMVVKLQEKRRRKNEMREVCRGMASIKCT